MAHGAGGRRAAGRPAGLGFILGPATVENLLLTQVGTILASDGPVPVVPSSVLNGSIQVTYDYTPAAVPEPALVGLVLAGASSAGWCRLRRRTTGAARG